MKNAVFVLMVCLGLAASVVNQVRAVSLSFGEDWFDANVPQYTNWPTDASVATNGNWNAGERMLADVAAVETPGVLEVYSDAGLSFAADVAKTPGSERVKSVIVDADVDLLMYSSTALPEVESSWKGGVLVACDGGPANYCGLAAVNGKNAWVALEGPAVRLGETVHLRMELLSKADGACVRYAIDGVACSWNGLCDLPIIAPGAVSRVTCQGEGALSGLRGTVGKAVGLVILFR